MNNNKVLFWASFFTLIAAGVGFAIRTKVLNDWSDQFGFSKYELGTITGGGLVGFGVTIIACSIFIDSVGYKPLMIIAFILHLASAAVTLAATPVFNAMGKEATYWCLYTGLFMFALANGMCEAVINPLVATIFPKQKTHYLNILHAGWPGGLILGGLLAYLFMGDNPVVTPLRWELPMAFFLVPTLLYGFMIFKEKFPVSEARAAGVGFGTMLLEFASPLLLFLLLLHAMVGYVELGTDSWITNIMDNVIKGKAILLFVYTSAIMFVLRFFAGPIVEKINPIGLLLVSAIFGCVGLYSLGAVETGLAIVVAATVYGIGKTFFWPTMLGVVGERFPKGGALTMGTIGGIGMLSAGLLGGPGIGYKQDYYASKNLEENAKATHTRYVAEEKKGFLMLPQIAGLDGAKVGVLKDDGKDLAKRIENLKAKGKELSDDKELAQLSQWWDSAKEHAKTDKEPVENANIYGGRMALKWTALVPFMMGVGYLILVFYFRSKGGYQVEVLHGEPPVGEHYTGGVEGPIE
ncbi:MAG: MFS transporter [Planctomycetaceae bacterium]